MEASAVYGAVMEMVEKTNRSLFITGKAGTGKTTMLRNIVSRKYKKTIVVAPTGVAAINAEGVTIHSFFQLPIRPLLPTVEGRRWLFSEQQVRSSRRELFRELELLIIDEISMVRADVLDAIDAVLRHYRRKPDVPFGGVQVVMFGDLYQLPPVVADTEWNMMKEFYRSVYFFDSLVVAETKPAVVELDTIFRQSDMAFINLLNELRNNQVSEQSYRMLYSRYNPDFQLEDDDDRILLTTHNAKADDINSKELAKLKSKSTRFTAVVEKEFPEKSYPTDFELELKEGAKVMFVLNDKQTPRRYFNGMIGRIAEIEDGKVYVDCDNYPDVIEVTRETWENKSYKLNKSTNEIEETLLGTFAQMPLRLAWAITIHKSQGLTFDKVVIDSAAAFASGQVYVAFSRCRTLDGIVLTSMVNSSAFRVDQRVAAYCATAMSEPDFRRLLESDKLIYRKVLLLDLFDLKPLYELTLELKARTIGHVSSFTDGLADFVRDLADSASGNATIGSRFQQQLRGLADEQVQERVRAAAGYFVPLLNEQISKVLSSDFVTESRDLAKNYTDTLHEFYDLLSKKSFIMDGVADDCSVDNFFEVRSRFVPGRFNVKAYALDRMSKSDNVKNPLLFKRLCGWRREYCEDYNIPLFAMFSNQVLKDVAAYLPRTRKELEHIKGFGKVKIERFGADCLAIVERFCREQGISSGMPENLFDEDAFKNVPSSEKKKGNTSVGDKKKPKEQKLSTYEQTLQLLKEGKTVEEVMHVRGLKESTVMGHVAVLVEKGELDAQDFVDGEILEMAMEKFAANKNMTLGDLFEELDQSVPYSLLRVAYAYFLFQTSSHSRDNTEN